VFFDGAGLRTWIGDTNLDLEFDSSDLVQVLRAGLYDDLIPGNATWATGDWNGDTEFDSGDLVAAFQEGGYDRGPRMSVTLVPEPSTCAMLLAGLLAIAATRRLTGSTG
jgi:hypothetical protein